MHAVIRNIYEAEPKIFIDEECTVSRIRFHHKGFVGLAEVHPDDQDFQSEIVGATIATSRARQSALKHAIWETELELKAKREMYWHGTKGMKEFYDPELADPFGGFARSVKSTEKKLQLLRAQLRSEEEGLTNYLKSQKEAITKIKGYRAKKDENN